MLILSRRAGETIIATTPSGERIELTLMRAMNGKARIGVNANTSVTVDREEIDARKQAEKKSA